jgi:transcriptional regulator with XRE-family HTH domain
MTDGLTGARADWIALWREAMAAQQLTHREVDDRAGFSEGYVSKLMCGQVREPTAATIAKMNRALGLRFHVERALTP